MSKNAIPASGVECIECLKHGHHAKAIEYVDVLKDAESGATELVALCVFHRDLDNCPGCVANDKDQAQRERMRPAASLSKKEKAINKVVTETIAKIESEAPPKKASPMSDPLEGIDLDKALALRRSGLSTIAVAKKMNVKPWHFQQSNRWKELTKDLPHPNAGKRDKTFNKVRPVATTPKANSINGPLKAMREDALEKIAKLQELVTAIDRVLAF